MSQMKSSLGDGLRKALRIPSLKLRPELLLGPQIPKPMHGAAPRVLMGTRWWDEVRRAAYQSTGYRCLACGVYKYNALGRCWLEGHEVYEVDYLLGRMTYVGTVPLCHYCHNYIHRGRLDAMLERGEISHRKYAAVVQYGDRVLRQAKLNLRVQYEGPVADWEDWRLVFNGKEYGPKFETFDAWRKEFE